MSNPEHLRRCANCGEAWIEHNRRGAAAACGNFEPVDEASLARKDYEAASRVKERLTEALDRQAALLTEWERTAAPRPADLCARLQAASDEVQNVMAEAREWGLVNDDALKADQRQIHELAFTLGALESVLELIAARGEREGGDWCAHQASCVLDRHARVLECDQGDPFWEAIQRARERLQEAPDGQH